ncbi:MAG: Lrp/AsnC ligand binding domain-containing protein [Candidatus Nanopelagicales bacterium]
MTEVHAYVLVQTEVGKAAHVARAIAALPGVTSAEDVTGPYDVIARVSASSNDDLGREVIGPLQAIQGITRTLTCSVVTLN